MHNDSFLLLVILACNVLFHGYLAEGEVGGAGMLPSKSDKLTPNPSCQYSACHQFYI